MFVPLIPLVKSGILERNLQLGRMVPVLDWRRTLTNRLLPRHASVHALFDSRHDLLVSRMHRVPWLRLEHIVIAETFTLWVASIMCSVTLLWPVMSTPPMTPFTHLITVARV